MKPVATETLSRPIENSVLSPTIYETPWKPVCLRALVPIPSNVTCPLCGAPSLTCFPFCATSKPHIGRSFLSGNTSLTPAVILPTRVIPQSAHPSPVRSVRRRRPIEATQSLVVRPILPPGGPSQLPNGISPCLALSYRRVRPQLRVRMTASSSVDLWCLSLPASRALLPLLLPLRYDALQQVVNPSITTTSGGRFRRHQPIFQPHRSPPSPKCPGHLTQSQ